VGRQELVAASILPHPGLGYPGTANGPEADGPMKNRKKIQEPFTRNWTRRLPRYGTDSASPQELTYAVEPEAVGATGIGHRGGKY